VTEETQRSGYVALVGRPNVGKSTLMNRILGQKLSIVTAKPQTTRQRISGIKTYSGGQVVYVDTPGIHRMGNKALNRFMNRIARASFLDVDVVLFLVEAGRWTEEDRAVERSLQALDIPVCLVVNKIDTLADKTALLAFLDERSRNHKYSEVFLVSALKGDGIDSMEDVVTSMLPFARPLYDEDQLTDRSERFLAAEFIREQLMQRMHKEIPYALTVEIESFERKDKILRIGAVIWVERESQKGIVIGKRGEALKQAASRARTALESFFGEKVFLETWVRVSRNWSNDERLLKKLGYDELS
jgi:GTP-binding protein Era